MIEARIDGSRLMLDTQRMPEYINLVEKIAWLRDIDYPTWSDPWAHYEQDGKFVSSADNLRRILDAYRKGLPLQLSSSTYIEQNGTMVRASIDFLELYSFFRDEFYGGFGFGTTSTKMRAESGWEDLVAALDELNYPHLAQSLSAYLTDLTAPGNPSVIHERGVWMLLYKSMFEQLDYDDKTITQIDTYVSFYGEFPYSLKDSEGTMSILRENPSFRRTLAFSNGDIETASYILYNLSAEIRNDSFLPTGIFNLFIKDGVPTEINAILPKDHLLDGVHMESFLRCMAELLAESYGITIEQANTLAADIGGALTGLRSGGGSSEGLTWRVKQEHWWSNDSMLMQINPK